MTLHLSVPAESEHGWLRHSTWIGASGHQQHFRPFLGLLMSAGSGGIYVDRPFTVVNPTARLSTDSSLILVGTFNRRLGFAAIGFLEYGIAFAAVANIIRTSYNTSQRSVITWLCPSWGWIISWSILPAAVYLVAQLTFTFAVKIG